MNFEKKQEGITAKEALEKLKKRVAEKEASGIKSEDITDEYGDFIKPPEELEAEDEDKKAEVKKRIEQGNDSSEN